MAIKAYLYNGSSAPVELTPRNGFVYRDEYNETRDSGTIVVRSNDHLDLESFDYVIIQGDVRGNAIVPKAMDIDSFSEEQTSFGDRESFDTTISLFSETKELERVPLPNLSITLRKGATPRSVAFYIQRYVEQYAPLYKVTLAPSFTYEEAWVLPQAVIDRFSGIDCPEFSWNKPTLYEVLTDLMQVDDCIPVIHNHTIGFIDLKERRGEADDSGFVRVVRSQSSQDYNQNLTVSMQNAISNRPVNMVEYISLRNEGEAILTTENMQLITQKPIYEISKVTAIVLYSYETGPSGGRYYVHQFREFDITDSIKEKMAYDVLSPVPVEIGGSDPYEIRENFKERQKTHQIANVWFTRGGRSIEGFGKSFQFINRNETAIQYILGGTVGISGGVTDAFGYGDFRDIMFKVEYTSLGEINVNIGKNAPLRNPHMAVFDNQGSSYVDIGQQSLFEYAKANRLANKVIEINGTYSAEADIPELAQTYKGSVIFSRELQFFDDVILFHAYATENYVLSNFFTSIRAKRRSWAIASGKEALTRHDNAKMYAEFSRKRKTDTTNTPMWSMYFASVDAQTLLSPLFKRYNDDSIKLAAMYTMAEADTTNYPDVGSTNAWFILDCQASATGMSLSFSVQLTDNYSAGERITIDDNGRYINNILPYADPNGEFSRITFRFLSYNDPADGEFVWGGYRLASGSISKTYETHTGVSDFDFRDKRYAKARMKPVATALGRSVTELYAYAPLKKDQREIIAVTAQIEYCSDSPDIIVKDRFVAMHHLVSGGSQESYSGLRILASSAIMTPATLPPADLASSRYSSVGFLYRATAGSDLEYASISVSGSTRTWQYSSVADNEKFAVMEGYYEADEPIASRIVIGRATKRATSLYLYERSLRMFGCDSKITEEDDAVPAGSLIFENDQAGVTLSTSGQNSIRIFWFNASSYASWGFCDQSGKIMLAFNNREEDADAIKRTVYLNLLETRDPKIRQSISNRHIVESRSEQ